MPYETLQADLERVRMRANELGAIEDLTDADVAEAEQLEVEQKRIQQMLSTYDNLRQIGTGAGDQPQGSTALKIDDRARIEGGRSVRPEGHWGFDSGGQFLQAVAQSAKRPQTPHPKLIAPEYANQVQAERSGGEGGYLVPPDFEPDVKIIHEGEASLLARTDNMPTSSNVVWVPTEEDVPHDFTGGVRAYWRPELATAQKTASTASGRAMTLDELTVLVDASNESLEDAPALETLLRRKMPEAVVARLNQALMRGTGVGMPIGIINAPAAITVARETGQGANTIIFENIANMYARFDLSLISGAAWMVNQDIWPQLMLLSVPVKNVAGTENVGGLPVYAPAVGGAASVAGAPFGTLLGLPVIPSEWCSQLGTVGDIVLVGWSMYNTRTRTGQSDMGIEVSTHILFDQNASQFRLIYRILGFPWWSKPKPRADSSNTNTLSMIVQLGAPA